MKSRTHSAMCALIVAFAFAGCNEGGPFGPEPSVGSDGIPQGKLRVAVQTDGPDLRSDFEGYLLRIYSWDIRNLDLNDVLNVALEPGEYRLELWGFPAYCSVDGDNPRTVSVGHGELTDVSFTVSCQMNPR